MSAPEGNRLDEFLSIQAQDFIEEHPRSTAYPDTQIPEHSSSGLQ